MSHLIFDKQTPLCKAAGPGGQFSVERKKSYKEHGRKRLMRRPLGSSQNSQSGLECPFFLRCQSVRTTWPVVTCVSGDGSWLQEKIIYSVNFSILEGADTVLVTSLKGGCHIEEALNYAKGKGSQSLSSQSSVNEQLLSSLPLVGRHLKTVIEEVIVPMSSISEIPF